MDQVQKDYLKAMANAAAKGDSDYAYELSVDLDRYEAGYKSRDRHRNDWDD